MTVDQIAAANVAKIKIWRKEKAPEIVDNIDMDGAYFFTSINQLYLSSKFRLFILFNDYENQKKKSLTRDYETQAEALADAEAEKIKIFSQSVDYVH